MSPLGILIKELWGGTWHLCFCSVPWWIPRLMVHWLMFGIHQIRYAQMLSCIRMGKMVMFMVVAAFMLVTT